MARTIRNLPRDNEERSTLRRPRRSKVRQNMRQSLREIAKLTHPTDVDPLPTLDRAEPTR